MCSKDASLLVEHGCFLGSVIGLTGEIRSTSEKRNLLSVPQTMALSGSLVFITSLRMS